MGAVRDRRSPFGSLPTVILRRRPIEAPIRVALDVTALLDPLTGVGQLVDELARGLRRRSDLELRPFALSWRGRDRLRALLPDAPPARPMPARPSRVAWSRFDHPTIRLAVGEVDVVHGPNFVVPPGGGAAEVVTVHDLTAWHHPELVHASSRAYPRLVERAVARGAHVHVVSRFVGDEVRTATGVPDERIHMIPNGASPLPAGDRRRGEDRAGAGEFVLAVGTEEPRKDYPGLVEALAALVPSHPEVVLVVAGGAGWGSDALDAAVARTGLADRVRRLGYVSVQDKADLLAAARALVYPSVYEGFGLVPLEAMAAGVPVVATAVGAVPEVVGDAAELCPGGDPAALAAAVARVLDDPARAAELVAAGRRRAASFPWSRTVEELVGLYRQLAA